MNLLFFLAFLGSNKKKREALPRGTEENRAEARLPVVGKI
jgi:hypothetical protein